MGAADVESVLEPTVVGAARRYRGTVVVVALLVTALAVLGMLVRPAQYQATATMSVPRSLLAQEQDSHQYLDSQVLLLGSREVAERAVGIANEELGGDELSERDFVGPGASLVVTPPQAISPESYGASLIGVSFTWPDARTAQAGANAVLEAFDEVRAGRAEEEGEARVAGVERAIEDARTRGQLVDLLNQRTETLVTLEVDLARRPTIVWARQPVSPVNRSWVRTAAVGLVVGGLLGVAVAFARASRRRRFDDRSDPWEVYHAPLMGTIPSPVPDTRSAGRLPVVDDPGSAEAEAFRFVAGAVERLNATIGPRLVMAFVSSGLHSGRSEVVANAALALAASGNRVLAIDADITRHDLTDLLSAGEPPGRGLSQVLADTTLATACIEPSPLHERVSVLACGEPPALRVEGEPYTKVVDGVLEAVKADFDVVLLDAAPLEQVARASELVAVSDAAIVVLGRDDPVAEHLGMVERLAHLRTEVAGYVFWAGDRHPWKRRGRRGKRTERSVEAEATPTRAVSPTAAAETDGHRGAASSSLSRLR